MFKKIVIALIVFAALVATWWLHRDLVRETLTRSFTTKIVVPSAVEVEKPNFPKTGVRVSGRVVHILAGPARGTGAVIGPYSIITVAHVVRNESVVMVDVGRRVFKWKAARVVGFLHASPEPIVLLHLLGDKRIEGHYFRLRTGYKSPSYVITPRGVFDWQPGAITPGDSGSPVLNLSGDVIGLVHGYRTSNKKSIHTSFSRLVWKPRKKKKIKIRVKPSKKLY